MDSDLIIKTDVHIKAVLNNVKRHKVHEINDREIDILLTDTLARARPAISVLC